MKSFSDFMLRGVWGPHSKLENNLNYGGPDCAKEAPPEFKIAISALMVSALTLCKFLFCNIELVCLIRFHINWLFSAIVCV